MHTAMMHIAFFVLPIVPSLVDRAIPPTARNVLGPRQRGQAEGPTVNPDRRTPAERGTSGAGDGAVARWAVVAGVAVHARVPMHLGRLRGLVRLVALPVQD